MKQTLQDEVHPGRTSAGLVQRSRIVFLPQKDREGALACLMKVAGYFLRTALLSVKAGYTRSWTVDREYDESVTQKRS